MDPMNGNGDDQNQQPQDPAMGGGDQSGQQQDQGGWNQPQDQGSDMGGDANQGSEAPAAGEEPAADDANQG